ncbi:putative ATP-binding protein [Paenibacillus sp. 598K]|nr:putative ATP-binding protein [Paenibacillus sp. 598K]
MHDVGSKEQIRGYAEQMDADITEFTLASQFRCNGSDGYLAWLEDVLEIRETANADDSISIMKFNSMMTRMDCETRSDHPFHLSV